DALLAEQMVWPPDDGGAANVRVGQQHLFDLQRLDLYAAPVDYVVAASGEVEEVGRVSEPEIAGPQPAVRTAGLNRPPARAEVGTDHLGAPDPDRAGLSRGQFATVRADDADRDPGGTAGRARPASAAKQRVRGDLTGRFGHAVGLQHADARPRLEPVQHGRGKWRRGRPGKAHPPRGRLGWGRPFAQDPEDRWDVVEPGHLEVLGGRPES